MSFSQSSGAPGKGTLTRAQNMNATLSGTPILSQLSVAPVGAFSLRAVNGVTAKAVNVVPGGSFPPSLMTQSGATSSTQTLGSGGLFAGSYTASCSRSDYGNGAPGAFAGVYRYLVNRFLWQVNSYPVGGGSVSTPTTAGFNGEWLQLQTPFPINLTGYSVKCGDISSIVLLASTDASSWTLVDSTNSGLPGTITKTGLNFAGYSYFRFVVLVSTAIYPFLYEVKFNGTVPSLAQDFYADRLGNLLTAPVTGMDLATWLGGATGYVATWYDQSGKGNDATQGTAANQPIIQRATKGPGFSALFNGTTNYFTSSFNLLGTPFLICASTRRNTSAVNLTYVGINGSSGLGNSLQVGYYNPSTQVAVALGGTGATITVPAYSAGSEPMAYDFLEMFATTGSGLGIEMWGVRNGSQVNGGNSSITQLLTSSGNVLIGAMNSGSGIVNYFSGEMYEILIFNQTITPYSTQIYNNQVGYTGL